MKSLTLLSFSIALILGLGFISCSDDAPEEKNQDGQEMPSARTEPLPFRMTPSGEAPKLSPPPAAMAGDTVPVRAPDGKPALFAVESGHLIMRYAGDRKGAKEIFFKDYGRYRRAIDSSGPTKEQDPVPPQNLLEITTPEYIGSYQYETRQGWRAPNPEPKLLQDLPANEPLSEFMLKKAGGTRLADTTINGYQTRVYRIDREVIVHTLWVWRGIAIREHFFAPFDNIEYWIEPVSLELGGKYPDALFAYPKDFFIVDRQGPPMPSALPTPIQPPPVQGARPKGAIPQGAPPQDAQPQEGAPQEGQGEKGKE